MIRNAGGVVTDDEIRSLAIGHYSAPRRSSSWAAETFSDLDEDVRQSLRRIESSPFITATTSLRGFVFDVATGKLREVTSG